MFAYIIALGIVVDDAIVAGENIYEYRQRGYSSTEAAIKGAQDVMLPITFAIITNCIAFYPLSTVPGVSGKIWGVIPVVVITVFLISWVESLLILPTHLSHADASKGTVLTKAVHRWQQRISSAIRRFVYNIYHPLLRRLLRWRYVILSLGAVILYAAYSYFANGRIGLIFFPRVESDQSVVTMTLPLGSPRSETERVRKLLEEATRKVTAENGGEQLSFGYFTRITENEVRVDTHLTDPSVRPLSTTAYTKAWRKAVGTVEGVQQSRFEADRGGPGSGASISISLSHSDIEALEQAAESLKLTLEEFTEVSSADSGYVPGKKQFDIQLKDAGRALGFNARTIAAQVRDAFRGAEVLKQQRGRNEVTVRLRRPESERANALDVKALMLRSPQGTEVPLIEVATINEGRAYTSIRRKNGRRTLTVTADVENMGQVSNILAQLEADALPELRANYLGLATGYDGRQESRRRSMLALFTGILYALPCIYVLLAIPFRSYFQPLIIMIAIPFGFVGALIGHVIMGYNISVISVMGMVALCGVVVNDSLVLIDFINRQQREEGMSAFDAACLGGARRFRPIILTTLTTFCGLAPMIFETARAARFLIPMALSLGFGILFATLITLILVPSLYLALDDVQKGMERVRRKLLY